MKPEYKKKPIRSYVIRAGRMTDGQRSAFDKWWPQYGLSLFDGPIELSEIFPEGGEVVLEVGFGMGDSLLQMTKSSPETNFIGIEVHPPGVGRLISCAGKEEVKNLKVYMADALDVLEDCIPLNSLDRFQLFFPDPWHKKKHNKRRILQPEFVQLIRDKLKPGGIFHMATDWEEYAEYAMEVMSTADGYENCAGQYLFSVKPEYRPNTKFEARGEKLGHGVWDIVFQKS
ncbi:tRNA (guanosine(46)-N7)-methyltransferase TrmB [Teredinibacter sp. KSP-S5-2]|uniref:tRNA (guanosine(46)-N7)-methyltransferase TrmB n=1 Tax=Teredinibacter sp. KSP-S5-2 TaxID=3034506 RepID=UPI0029344992|nr:tRNA (guanosine(46)-N7)-methyltransferase TrmB [Teredinibacter sp. KSP-S5-2]WNO11749.1 tRNA (guanosine(46)-N7)-methyltransferase TrmB [Teredinibacter sp. KSP-S5-2]